MGRSGFKKTGVVIRNIKCSGCDKTFTGVPRMVDKLMDLHLRAEHGLTKSIADREVIQADAMSNKNNPTVI